MHDDPAGVLEAAIHHVAPVPEVEEVRGTPGTP